MATPKRSSPSPGFEVDIRSGGRAAPPAAASEAVPAPRTLSPVAQRRARTRRRLILAGAGLIVALVAALGVIWWVGQPPPNVLARVNGENITSEQVDHELLMNRALTALANDGKEVSTTRSAVLEDLISRRMQAQDAARAGVTLTDAQVNDWILTYFQGRKWTKAQVMEALTGYGLTWDDMLISFRDVAVINTYLIKYVARGAKDADDALARQDAWLGNLESTSRVERLRNPDEAVALRVGAQAPDFTVQDLDGKTLKLADLRGHRVLVNFWATWCQPCRIEIPTLVNAYHQLRSEGKDLEIVAVAVNSAPDTVVAFRNEFKMPFTVAPDTGSQIATLYYVGAIPTSYLIDRDGVVRWIHVNIMDDKLLAQQLAALP